MTKAHSADGVGILDGGQPNHGFVVLALCYELDATILCFVFVIVLFDDEYECIMMEKRINNDKIED